MLNLDLVGYLFANARDRTVEIYYGTEFLC